MAKNIIRIGPAGWSYKDWEKTVFPQRPGPRFDPLQYLAQFFDTIEINSSFYRPPTASTTKSWVERVADNRNFSFTAKLYRVFTHERGKATAEDEKAFREGIDVLADEGHRIGIERDQTRELVIEVGRRERDMLIEKTLREAFERV